MVFISDENDYITKQESNKKFVNRDNPLSILEDRQKKLIHLMKENKRLHIDSNAADHGVIDYYGIGGKGKSSLIRKSIIQYEMDYIFWDIDRQRRHGIIEVLTYFRDKLVRNHGFTFEQFDKHVSVYYIDEDLNLTEFEEASYGKVGANFLLDVGKTLLDNITFGLAGNVLSAYENAKETKGKLNRTREFKNLEQLEALEVWEQIKEIKRVFEKEYNENMLKRNEPMVIYVDTFELYNLNTQWLFAGENTTKYGYGLCHSLAFTLWVFSGRDSINLKSEDKWDNLFYESIKLDNFNEKISRFLLTDVLSITDEEVVQKIWEETEGYPLLLNLYENMYRDAESKEHFLAMFDDLSDQDVLTRLSIRYLRYLEEGIDSERASTQGDLLRRLACIGTWSFEDSLLQSSLLSNQKNAKEQIQEINQKSLVNATLDEDGQEVFYMDRTVQDTLLEGQIDGNPLIEDSIKQESLEYLIEKSGDLILRSKEIDQIIRLSILLNSGEPLEGIYELVITNLEPQFQLLISQQNIRKVMDIRFRVLTYFGQEFFESAYGENVFLGIVLSLMNYNLFDYSDRIDEVMPKLPKTKNIHLSMAQYEFFAGDSDSSINYYESALEALPPIETQLSDQDVAIVIGYIETLILNSTLDKISDFEEELMKRIPHNKDTYFEVALYKAIQGYYAKLGYNEKAVYYYEKLMSSFPTANLTPEQQLYMEGELVSIYAFSGQESQAIIAGEEYIEKMKRFKGVKENDVNRDKIYNSLSNAWRKLGNFEESYRYLMELIEWREEHLGEGHYRTIQSYNNLGFNYLDQFSNASRNEIHMPELLKKAESVLLIAEERAEEYLGHSHYLTAMIISNLGQLSLYQYEFETALARKKESYQIKAEIYSETSFLLFEARESVYICQYYYYISVEPDLIKLQTVKEDFMELLKNRQAAGELYKEDLETVNRIVQDIDSRLNT